jgi:outer membrane protein OmpA-like peptidoglycan-associated protein
MKIDDVRDEIAAGFEFEGWAVSRPGDSALMLKRYGKVYRVGVHQRERCMALGAGAGALVGGGVASATVGFAGERDNQFYWGTPAGVVGGALIGGLAGYFLCPPPPPPPPPEKIILRGVHFDFDKSNIRPQDAAVLDEAAETLKSHPNVTVNVNGYCARSGRFGATCGSPSAEPTR